MTPASVVLLAIGACIVYALGMGVCARIVARSQPHQYVVNGDYSDSKSKCHGMDYCFPHGALVYLWPIAWPLRLAWRLVRGGVIHPLVATYKLGRGA